MCGWGKSNERYSINRRQILQSAAGIGGIAVIGGAGTNTATATLPDDCDGRVRYDDFENNLDNWDVGGDVSVTSDGVVTEHTARITDSESADGSVGRIKWECAGEFSTHDEFELRGTYQAVTDTPYNYRFGIEDDTRFLLKIDPSSDAIGFGDRTWTSVSGETIESAFVGTWVEFRLAFDGTGTVSAKVWEREATEPDDWQISTQIDDVSGYLRASAGQNDHGREMLVDDIEIIVPGEDEVCVGEATYDDFEDGLNNWDTGGDVSTVDNGVVTETAAKLTDSEDGDGSVGRLEWTCAGDVNTHDEVEVRGVYQAVTDASFNYRFGISGEDDLWFLIDPSNDAISFTSSRLASPADETIDDAFIGSWTEFRIQFNGTGTVRAKAWRYSDREPGEWQITTEVDSFAGSIRISAGQNNHGRELLVDEIELTDPTDDDGTDDEQDTEDEDEPGEEESGDEDDGADGEQDSDDDDEPDGDETDGKDDADDDPEAGNGQEETDESDSKPDDDGSDDESTDAGSDDEGTGDETEDEESDEPSASFDYTPSDPEAGQQVAFDASVSTAPTGELVHFAWDFGDGDPGEGESVTHTFENSGGYNVTLSITDDNGREASVTEQITIDADDEDSIPGFGVTGSLATLGGVGYLLKRRLSGSNSTTE